MTILSDFIGLYLLIHTSFSRQNASDPELPSDADSPSPGLARPPWPHGRPGRGRGGTWPKERPVQRAQLCVFTERLHGGSHTKQVRKWHLPCISIDARIYMCVWVWVYICMYVYTYTQTRVCVKGCKPPK